MERYIEYILGLDVATVISTLLIFIFGNLETESVFLLATELLFTLAVLSLSFTFLYFVHVGENNWLLIPSLVIFAAGAVLTFISWFIGGIVALGALLILLLSKDLDSTEKMGIIIGFIGFGILAVMPPLSAFMGWSVGLLDYLVISFGIVILFLGIITTLKVRNSVEVASVGFILLSLSFMFLAPAHELLTVHANGSYGLYDNTIIILSSIAFFIFFVNLIIYRISERKIYSYIEKGYARLKKGKYEDALAAFKKAYKALPNDERVLNGLGLTLMKLGRFRESEEYLRKLNSLTHDKVYKTNLGNLYFRSGNIDKAMKVYEEVLSEDPEFYNALNNLARCYMEKGEYEKAKELLEKAIAIDQDKKAAKVNYYFLLTAMGLDEEAGKYKAQLGGMIE